MAEASATGVPTWLLPRLVSAPWTPAAPTLDAISAHWRMAFLSAQEALAAIARGGPSLHFPPQELRDLGLRLEQERVTTAKLLDQIAGEERVPIHHRLSAPRATKTTLGLPDWVQACTFDLDGVLTASAEIHAAAWAVAFDELLARRVEQTGDRFAPFMPFDSRTDYYRHLHGRPRLDGVQGFLASRGIRLPQGRPSDAPGAETVNGLANRKNQSLQELLDQRGVAAFIGSLLYLEGLREAGVPCAVVSPSANTAAILRRSGLEPLVRDRIDGNIARAEHLRPKPAPDTLQAACDRLGVAPEATTAFETTLDGVTAARAAHLGYVIAVDRTDRNGSSPFLDEGVDRVVADLSALAVS